jgi:hypothetical protein
MALEPPKKGLRMLLQETKKKKTPKKSQGDMRTVFDRGVRNTERRTGSVAAMIAVVLRCPLRGLAVRAGAVVAACCRGSVVRVDCRTSVILGEE